MSWHDKFVIWNRYLPKTPFYSHNDYVKSVNLFLNQSLFPGFLMALEIRFPFEKYSIFFRVYDPRAVTAFIGDPIEPKSTKPSNEVEFSEDDKLKVQELRDWWKQKAKTVPGTVDSNGFSQELTQDLSKLTVDTQHFNFVCKVVKVAGKGG